MEMKPDELYAAYQSAIKEADEYRRHIADMYRMLGLLDTLYADTTADRSYDVYKCKLCERRWAAKQTLPCWSCKPEAFAVFNIPITKKVPGIQLGDCDPEFMPDPHL